MAFLERSLPAGEPSTATPPQACEQEMIEFAERRQTEATKVNKRRAKGFARRAVRERNGE
jgi:hypothetical protein